MTARISRWSLPDLGYIKPDLHSPFALPRTSVDERIKNQAKKLDKQELDQMLTELEALSDEQAKQQLDQKN